MIAEEETEQSGNSFFYIKEMCIRDRDSGEVIIDGKVVNDVPASQRGIGFVFQNYALFRYMTVYDNVAFGLKVQKADKKKIDARVRELIKLCLLYTSQV